ncbi:MAG: hypothetical protein KDA24_26235 [Deltaproteobacteria bacterium]|nr:hypothetical protein [Deltaproteobacteria bacterium]
MTPWRPTLVSAAVLGGCAVVVLLVALGRDAAGTPFGPGELDVLLAARSMAAGVWPPIWVGSVHPDAVGTWLGAAVLAPLLRLGLSDLFALKALAAAHYGLLVAASAGLATRRAGVIAGAVCGAALTLGSPALVAAHSKYLATTVEIAGVEVLLLWACIELLRRPEAHLGAVALLGTILGVALVYSLHVAVLAVLVAGALLHRREHRWLRALALAVPAALAQLPFVLGRDPLGPQQAAVSIKTLGPGELIGLIGIDDAVTLVQRAPFALLSETEHIPADSWLRFLHVPLAILLAGTVFVAFGLLLRRRLAAPEVLVTLFGVGTAAPLLVAGDLLGYPAAYRYYAPVLAPAAILLGVAVVRLPRSDSQRVAACGLVAALVLPGLITAPRATSTELSRPMAAYFAGQHRLGFARQPLHTHFLMLTPFVSDTELPGWLQGYGVHVGREYTRQAPIATIERNDSRASATAGIPDIVDRLGQKMRPERWLLAADWLEGDARDHFLVGVGLGIAEDGELDEADVSLLTAAGPQGAASVWRGIGAAMGERWYWTGSDRPLVVQGDLAPLSLDAAGSAMAGLSATGGQDAPPLERLLDPRLRPRGTVRRVGGPRLAHPHPFTYADLGVLGRGEVPMGPR